MFGNELDTVIKSEIQKVVAVLEYFCCTISDSVRPGHTVGQGQMVTH